MIGNNKSGTARKGQVLLIAVMLLATVITVVMTITFNSTSETKVAKLQEDSQKALAAAQAGIEAALQQGTTVPIASLGQFNAQGITGNAEVKSVSAPYFISPLLQKDEQYSYYLADYPALTTGWTGSLNISFVSEAGQCPSLEVMVITIAGAIQRYAYNTCAPLTINNVDSNATIQTPLTLEGSTFQWRTRDPIAVADGSMMFIKVLGGRTKLGIQNVIPNNLPSQGKTIESEARTQSGVVKKVQLFQSFPQVPASFMTTSF
jgi:uncharacterized protein (UPF0333 family)